MSGFMKPSLFFDKVSSMSFILFRRISSTVSLGMVSGMWSRPLTKAPNLPRAAINTASGFTLVRFPSLILNNSIFTLLKSSSAVPRGFFVGKVKTWM